MPRYYPQAKPIGSLLTGKGARFLVEKTQQIQLLDRVLQQHLPDLLVGKLRVANLKNGSLLLTTQSAAWSMRLHHCKPKLLIELKKQPEFITLTKINCRVLPTNLLKRPKSPPPSLSSASAKHIKTSAATIEHQALKAALERLGR